MTQASDKMRAYLAHYARAPDDAPVDQDGMFPFPGPDDYYADLTFGDLRALQKELEALAKDLRECRDHLSNVLSDYPPPEERAAFRKFAAEWLADWDGRRMDPGAYLSPNG